MKENTRQLNPKHVEELLKMVNSGPFFTHMGIRILELGSGYAKAEIDTQRHHLNNFGSIHGGVYASLMDTAAYWSGYCDLDEDAGWTSLDLSINDLAMARPGKLTAVATAVKQGRSVCLSQVRLTDEAGRLIAYGTSKLMVLHGKQSMSDAFKTLGYPGLPPKFL